MRQPHSRRYPGIVAAVAAVAVLGAMFVVDLTHNTLSWEWKGLWPATVIAAIVYCLAIGCFLWASRVVKVGPVAVGVLVPALLLSLVGFFGLRAEYGSEVKPREPSPIEFRATRAVLMSIPLIIVAARLARRRKQSRVQGRQPDCCRPD